MDACPTSSSDLYCFLVTWRYLIGPSLAALITAGAGAWFASITIKAQRRIARQRATLDFIEKRRWDNDYLTARQEFIKVRDMGNLKQWAETHHENAPERSTVRNMLNDYELVSIGIQEEILDEKIYKRWWKGTLLADFEASKEFIHRVGNLYNIDAFKEFKLLAETWKSDRNLIED